MRDEAPIAATLSDADEVLGYGERGFGINLDPLTDLVSAVTAVPAVARAGRIGVASELPTAVERIGASASGAIVGADAALHRIRLIKDWDELEKVNAAYELCWLGQEAVSRGAVPGASEIELFTAAQSAAQIAYGRADRVRLRPPVGAERRRGVLPDPRCRAGAPWRRATQ